MDAIDQYSAQTGRERVPSNDGNSGAENLAWRQYSANAFRDSRSKQSISAGSDEIEHLPKIELMANSIDYKSMAIKMSDAMFKSFYTDEFLRPPKFYASHGDRETLSTVWDIGEVLASTISMEEIANGYDNEQKKVLKVLDKYWDGRSKPPGYDCLYGPNGAKYYDDNSWIGIAFLDAYKLHGKTSELEAAKLIFQLQEFGTQGTEKLAHSGGVFWTQEPGNEYRATVSTAGAAQLGLKLYEHTNDKQYLEFAKRQFDWVNENLRSTNGLYFDGMDKGGAIHKEQYTYNQGLMLGDATLLYKATGDQKYLDQAQDIAKKSLEYFTRGTDENGGKLETFSKQPLFFNAVFFKNLMLLDSIATNPEYRRALSDYASDVIQKVDWQSGLVKVNGKSTLLDQSSAMQTIALAQKYRLPEGLSSPFLP